MAKEKRWDSKYYRRRVVSIPKFCGNDNILALLHLGKEIVGLVKTVEMKFFEVGVNGVKKWLLEEYISKGGSQKTFNEKLKKAEKLYPKEL